MDKERMDDLARDPRFIPGIYNYCDRWCERCALASRCLNYAIGQEMESGSLQTRDAENEAFWDKVHETFESTMEEIEDQAEETDFDLDEEELEDNEYDPQDANGSAKVALLGIERSVAAWATLQRRFPDHEDILFALGTLKRLLRQVEASFPNARAFRRPGFDTDET